MFAKKKGIYTKTILEKISLIDNKAKISYYLT